MRAGIDMVHVPFRGAGPALTGVLGAQVEVTFASTPPSIPLIRSGKLHDVRRVRQDDRRGHRKVGQGDPGSQHQAGVRAVAHSAIFHSARYATLATPMSALPPKADITAPS